MLIFYLPSAVWRERDIGTVRYCIYFLIVNAIGQALYVSLDYIFYEIICEGKASSDINSLTGAGFGSCYGGLWVILMIDIVIRNY
jgi:hypothetical protein